ncbi:MAG: Rieske (2Fe-2S) protein [Desulfomonile tiedjei]|nr:Rieske (2Fe-2S) protein [Desulfomonile tiedjei]
MSWIVDLLKAFGGVCRTAALDATMWTVQGSQITVNLKDVPELQKPGGAVFLKGGALRTPVLVVKRPDDGYLCVENRCTHMGRKLDPEPDGTTLRCCSVSHSTFDYQGNELTGPAKGPIRVYPSQQVGSDLVISLE